MRSRFILYRLLSWLLLGLVWTNDDNDDVVVTGFKDDWECDVSTLRGRLLPLTSECLCPCLRKSGSKLSLESWLEETTYESRLKEKELQSEVCGRNWSLPSRVWPFQRQGPRLHRVLQLKTSQNHPWLSQHRPDHTWGSQSHLVWQSLPIGTHCAAETQHEGWQVSWDPSNKYNKNTYATSIPESGSEIYTRTTSKRDTLIESWFVVDSVIMK